VYAIDVTNPTSPIVLWEKSAADLKMANFGNAVGKPVIANLNNGSTGVIIGNGYNGSLDHSSVFVLDIYTGAWIREIDTGKGSSSTPNGMASPAGWDQDRSGTVDLIYAGDLLGNVWELDVSDSDPTKWGSAFGATGSVLNPIFVAKDASNTVQPITGGISIGLNPTSFERWIYFGTGSYLTTTDPSNLQTQTWYGLMDGAVIAGRAALKPRTIGAQTTVASQTVRAFEKPVVGDMVGFKGWYVDLLGQPGNVQQGERMVSAQQFLGSVLLAASIIPDNSPCSPGGRGFISAIDPFTGGSLTSTFFDTNGDGSFTSADDVPNGGSPLPAGSLDFGVGLPSTPSLLDELIIAGGSGGNTNSKKFKKPFVTGRISWRELVGD
jgi:type IV pilus assembly protein PilY1